MDSSHGGEGHRDDGDGNNGGGHQFSGDHLIPFTREEHFTSAIQDDDHGSCASLNAFPKHRTQSGSSKNKKIGQREGQWMCWHRVIVHPINNRVTSFLIDKDMATCMDICHWGGYILLI